jgi:hypothetical protein
MCCSEAIPQAYLTTVFSACHPERSERPAFPVSPARRKASVAPGFSPALGILLILVPLRAALPSATRVSRPSSKWVEFVPPGDYHGNYGAPD